MIKRAILVTLRPLLNEYAYTVRHGLAKGLRRKGGLGFIPKRLTEEEKFLLGLCLYNQTVYDVGGWEGIFTLFFSRAVGENGKVITFEPNPENYSRIIDNVKINNFENVIVYPFGLGRDAGKARLLFPRGALGEGSVKKGNQFQGTEKKFESIEVELDSLDNLFANHQLPEPDFIKVDVEGSELDVLYGMRQTIQANSPTLFIEIHNVNEDAKSVCEFLFCSGYDIHHVESGQLINQQTFDEIEGGHIYCTGVKKLKSVSIPEEN